MAAFGYHAEWTRDVPGSGGIRLDNSSFWELASAPTSHGV